MAQEDIKDTILDIKVKYSDAIKGIGEYQKRVEDLKKSNADLRKSFVEGDISAEEYRQSIAANKVEMDRSREAVRALEKEIKNNIKAEKEQEGSLTSLRAQLSNLTKEYDNLSKAEREGAKGTELRDQINATTEALSQAEEETGRFQRKVGSYEEAIKSAISSGNPFVDQLMKMTEGSNTVKGGLANATAGAKAFGKQLLALLANPVVLLLAAMAAAIGLVVGAFKLLTEAFNRTESNAVKVNVIIEKVRAVFGLLLKVLEPVAKFIVDKLVDAFEKLGNFVNGALAILSVGLKALGFDNAAKSVYDFGASLKEAGDDAERLTKLEHELTVSQREARKIQLLYQRDAEKLRQIRDDESLSIQERIKANEDLGALLQKQSTEELSIANNAVEVAQLRIKMYGETKEALDALAVAQTNVIDIEERITGQQSEQLKNLNSLRKESADKYKEQKATELEMIRQAEDSALSLVKEGVEKQRQSITLSYNRQIEDLKKKLSEDKNLTKAAREAINQTILNLEKQQKADLALLSDEVIAQQIEKETERINLKLAAVKKGSEQEYQLQMQLIEKNKEAELQANAQLAVELQQSEADILSKYNQQYEDLITQRNASIYQKQSEALRLEWENRLLQVQEGSMLEYELKTQQAQAEYDSLLTMDAEQKALLYESELAYTNAVLELKKNLTNAEKAQQQAITESSLIQLQAAQTIGGAFSDMLNTFAEDNEALAGFAKTVALFNIGLSTGEALAKGTAAAQSVPFPGNLIAIATTIATVMANIARAKQLLSANKEPKAPSFATGGIVSGPGSGTSDSIVANLSNGESVMTAAATSMFAPLLSSFNQLGGGVPVAVVESSNQVVGEDMLSRAFAKALTNLPNPVVGVDEISRVNNRVQVLESIGKQ